MNGALDPTHPRVDGPAKVSGAALYVADFPIADVAYGAFVTSDITRGRITEFHLDEAKSLAGCLGVFTHEDFADEIRPVKHLMVGGYTNSSLLPFASNEVHYAGQIIALVVAESTEIAGEAGQRIRVDYRAQASAVDLHSPGTEAVPLAKLRPKYEDPKTGDAQAALAISPARFHAEYETPIQHHNPIELYGSTCVWDGPKLTVYEATRYVKAAQYGLAEQLGMDPENVRFICPFLGGHFGSRLALSQYTAPVALAAKKLGRPVRYVATRPQCFTIMNHRCDTRHHVAISASGDGHFTSLRHQAEMTSSRFDSFAMQGTDVTASLYAWRNVETKELVVQVDRNTPGPMRAPPEVPYLFAIESAVDEFAHEIGMDPIELRRRNDTVADPLTGKPFAPRSLMQCFDAGAAAFQWQERKREPGSARKGEWLVGYGCASSVRPVKRAAATMRITLYPEHRALVETAHHEIGNGIYTILAMEAAKQLEVAVDAVTVRLGDSSLPAAGISGGSSTTTSLVPTLRIGCAQVREKLARANAGWDKIEVLAEATPEGAPADAIERLRQGKLVLASKPDSVPWSFGAQFAEVHVHSETCEIRVVRLLGAFSAGYILDRLTAMSQLKGGMIWGLGSALLEETVPDPGTGRYVNDNLSDYLVATAADTPEITALLLDDDEDPDDLRGLGELGIIGVNAAIANAVYNATGRRVRRLPIRVDSLL